MVPIIKTDGLTKDYGRVRALDNLSLEVQEGEVLGFLGPNGSGKTTTIRLLLDLIRPTRGSASIGGFDCQKQSLGARRLIGYLPGEMPVYPELTGEAYLSYLGRLGADPPDPATVLRLLDRFEIDASGRKRRMRELSHGMKRKFGIVSALMARPRVAILDEPTSGLDPLMIEAFAETLAEEQRQRAEAERLRAEEERRRYRPRGHSGRSERWMIVRVAHPPMVRPARPPTPRSFGQAVQTVGWLFSCLMRPSRIADMMADARLLAPSFS